jgi:hypothetical protein
MRVTVSGWGQKVVGHIPWGSLNFPEWVPSGAGSREVVLGTLWLLSCPSGPMHAIHADTDHILTHMCKRMHIPAHTFRHTGDIKVPMALTYRQDTDIFQCIIADVCTAP